MKYWDAINTVTGHWLCYVEATSEYEAKIKASQISGVHTNFIRIEVWILKTAFIDSNYTVRRTSLELLNEYVHGKGAKRPDQPVFTGEGWYKSGKEWILIHNPFEYEWQMLVYGEDPREEFKRVADLPEIP